MSKKSKNGKADDLVTIPISQFINKRIEFESVLNDFDMHPISTSLPYPYVKDIYKQFSACCNTTTNTSLTVDIPSAIWNRVEGII